MASKQWNPNRICENDEVWGYNPTFSTKEFLRAINSPRLQDMPQFAEWIEEAARQYDVDQRFLLVTAEKEQSFLTRRAGGRGWQRALDYTLGFGATDSHDIPRFKGVRNQIFSCAKAVGTWYKPAAAKKVGKPWRLSDGTVTPENAATAAQYMYTPHISGAKVFWQVWNRWRNLLEVETMRGPEIVKPLMVAINDGERDEERVAGYLIRDPHTGKTETYVRLREFLGDADIELDIGQIDWSKEPPVLHIYTKDYPDEYRHHVAEPEIPAGYKLVKFPRAQLLKYEGGALANPGQPYYNPWPQYNKGLLRTADVITARLSDHFHGKEFLAYGSRARFLAHAGHHATERWTYVYKGERYPDYCRIDPRLVELLEDIRNHYEQPVTIISGFRPYHYNKFIGGVSKSFHMAGMAADIKIHGVPIRDVVAYLRSYHPKGGRGIAKTWMHVDVRPWSAEWYY